MAEKHQLKGYVSESIHNRLKAFAALRGVTISRVLAEAIEAYLKRKERKAA